MTSRVIRPTRIMADPYQVVIPEHVSAGAGSALPESMQKEALRSALAEATQALEERDKVHASEIAGMEARVEARVRSEVANAVADLTGTTDRIIAERIALLSGAEETVIRIAVALAGRIVKDKLEIDEETVLRTVRDALALAADRQQIVVRIHPDDLALVEEHEADWLAKLNDASSLRMEGDSRIRRGGCLVETETGEVDARIDKQFQTMTRTLIEKIR